MSDHGFRLAAGLTVAAFVLVAWGPTLRNGFLNYDDPQMIVENPRLQAPGPGDVVAVFSETREFAYLPFYVLALMPDAAFFGMDPAGFHLGSILWHIIGSVLVLAFLHALTGSRTVAFVAAAVFATHPMAAESVAWASGRKDQVSFVFLMLALAAVLGHLRRGGWSRIALAGLLAAVALLSKGSAVVYPLLALLLFAFVRSEGSLHARARPLALLGSAVLVAGAGAALHLQIALAAGTAGGASFTTPWDRFLVFLEATGAYWRHMVAPSRLSIHYEPTGGLVPRIFGAIVLAVLMGFVVLLWRRRKEPRAARLIAAPWMLAAILPFNGVFPETSVAMADRYAFHALPAFGMVVGMFAALLRGWGRAALVVVVLATYVTQGRMRAAEFRDGETVFRAARCVEPEDSLVALKLGEALRDKPPVSANRVEAEVLIRKAASLARDPVREARARLVLADTLLQRGRFAGSVDESDRLLVLEREHGAALRALGFDATTVRFNRAAGLLGAGKRPDAVAALDDILRADPAHRPARLLRAGLGAQEAFVSLAGGSEGAARDRAREEVNRTLGVYESVIAELVDAQGKGLAGAADQEIQARTDLARLLVRADWRPDRLNAALMQAAAIVTRHPRRAEGFLARAQIVRDVDADAAARDLRAAVDRKPRSIPLLRSLAGAFLALGKNREAIAVLETARSVDPGDPGVEGDLRGIYVAAARSHLGGAGAGQDLTRARAALDLALALGREEPEVLDVLAACLEAEGKDDEAGAVWETLHAVEPDNPKGRLGVARFRQRRGLAILADLKALTESAPADRRKARREELLALVAADFKAAAEMAPDNDEIAFARGWLRNRLHEEVAAAERQGHVAMQIGDDAAAMAAFARTVALDPDNLAANDALARLHMKDGRRDDALRFARKFLGLAAKMNDPTPTLQGEIEFVQRMVSTLEAARPESAPESR